MRVTKLLMDAQKPQDFNELMGLMKRVELELTNEGE